MEEWWSMSSKLNRNKSAKKTVFHCIISGIMLIMIIIIGILIYHRNSRFQQVKIYEYTSEKGGKRADGVEIDKITGYLLEQKEIEEQYGKDVAGEYEDGKLLVVQCNIKNTSEDECNLAMYQFELETTGWSTAIAADLMKENEMSDTVEPNEEKEVTLLYSLFDVSFTDKQWEQIEKKEFFLTQYNYPDKWKWKVEIE